MSSKNERPLAGKIAVVTGGSRGIGAAIAKRLAADGADVAITYSKGAKPAASIVKAIKNLGGDAMAVEADAGDPTAVKNAIAQIVQTFGRIDILVSNAGIAFEKSMEDTTVEEFDRLFAVNVRGAFFTVQTALKHMGRGSRVITIGSCLGERVAVPNLVLYSATKGAIKMFVQGLARELGHRGITVNNIQPGNINTDMNPASGELADMKTAFVPLGRYAEPEELAALAAFIAGPGGSYITGANLTADGGLNA